MKGHEGPDSLTKEGHEGGMKDVAARTRQGSPAALGEGSRGFRLGVDVLG